MYVSVLLVMIGTVNCIVVSSPVCGFKGMRVGCGVHYSINKITGRKVEPSKETTIILAYTKEALQVTS